MEGVGIFYGHLVNFYGHWVYFYGHLVYVSRYGMLFQENYGNLVASQKYPLSKYFSGKKSG
jgi:hypothetical protein